MPRLIVLLLVYGGYWGSRDPQDFFARVSKRDAPNHVEHEVQRVIAAYTQLLKYRTGIKRSNREPRKMRPPIVEQDGNVHITIHMPQRTSKILLVRLTANRNALLFQIRVTSFARYTV